MRNALRTIVLIFSTAMFAADTFHVRAVRNLQATDPEPVTRAFRVYVITGTVGRNHYITQQTFSWGSQHLEVGHDYEITKQDGSTITVNVTDKKGRKNTERLHITSAEEATE